MDTLPSPRGIDSKSTCSRDKRKPIQQPEQRVTKPQRRSLQMIYSFNFHPFSEPQRRDPSKDIDNSA